MSADNPPIASTRSGPAAWRADPLERRMVDRIAAQLRRVGERPRPTRRSTKAHHAAAFKAETQPSAAATATDAIGALLRLARRQTGMDVAMLGRIHDGHEIVDALAGDAASFGLAVGQRIPLEATYCHLLLEGRIGNIVSDVTSKELLRDLPVTPAAGVGAYIGVPLTSPAATLFVLCCLAHERRPSLGEHHVVALRRLAQSVAPKLSVC